MAKGQTRDQRAELFLEGWTRGVSGQIPKRKPVSGDDCTFLLSFMDDIDFQRGYTKGYTTYLSAHEEVVNIYHSGPIKELDHPPINFGSVAPVG